MWMDDLYLNTIKIKATSLWGRVSFGSVGIYKSLNGIYYSVPSLKIHHTMTVYNACFPICFETLTLQRNEMTTEMKLSSDLKVTFSRF